MWVTRVCAQPSCGKIAEQGKPFCKAHADVNYRTAASIETSKLRRANVPWNKWYGWASWARVKAAFLATDRGDHGICEHRDPKTGERCDKPTEEIDHIVPHRGDWSLFIDPKNLQGLCSHHHSQKTAREDGGFGNQEKKEQCQSF